MKKIKVLLVFGTRPEAVKMAPVYKELTHNDAFEAEICVTAQHRSMLDQVLSVFGITPDYDLDIMKTSQSLAYITTSVLEGMDGVLEKAKPDIVLVHGDTTTTFAAALAAFYHHIPIGHVEAGLRTYDMSSPFPEEMNRRLTGPLASLHFSPTAQNRENLRGEHITRHIYVTGNTVIDAMRDTVKTAYRFHNEGLADLTSHAGRILLMTAHRRENLGKPLENICNAVRRVAAAHPDCTIVYPVHLNPAVQQTARSILGVTPNVILCDPLDVLDMHNLMARSYLILTDSGGLQEEAPALGKPVLVLRTETERPEAVEAGTVRMAGIEEETIFRMTEALLNDSEAYDAMAHAVNPYGDGHACARIAQAILHFFGEAQPPESFVPQK